MTWSLTKKSLELPPLLWWQFRNQDGDEATLYFGAATRKWYTSARDIEAGEEFTEELRGMLPAEDIAAALATAIAWREGGSGALLKEMKARVSRAVDQQASYAIKTSIKTLFEGGDAAGALAKFLKDKPK